MRKSGWVQGNKAHPAEGVRPTVLGWTGQHTAEFIVVMGIVALVTVWIQSGARQRFQWGVQRVSDEVFGANCVDLDGNGTCDCTDQDRNGVCDRMIIDPISGIPCNDENGDGKCDHPQPKAAFVGVKSGVDESGDASFVRRTHTASSVVGNSVNEDARCLSGCVTDLGGALNTR